jgi:UrcA family protein
MKPLEPTSDRRNAMSRFNPNANHRPRAFIAALAALGVLGTAALTSSAVASAEDGDGFQTNVYYNAYDLTTAQGTRALYRRIVHAAAEVCPGSDSLSTDVANRSKDCQRTAIARAVAQIGSTQLAALDAKAVARRG